MKSEEMSRKLILSGFMSSLLLLSVIAYSLPVFAQGPDLEGKPEIIGVTGIIPGQNLTVHILAVVQPGQDRNEVAKAALAGQGARPPTAEEYTFTSLSWPQFSNGAINPSVEQFYNVDSDPFGNAGFTAFNGARDVWTDVPSSSFEFSYGGETTRCPSLVKECPGRQVYDNNNDVAWVELRDRFVLGVAWSGTSSQTGPEVDIAMNSDIDSPYSWSFDDPNDTYDIDVQSVLAHEEGHAAGIGHSGVTAALMYPTYQNTHRDLHQDDIDAISAKYSLIQTGSSPIVSISSPASNSEFNSGALIGFAGSASDAENGNLTSQIVWTDEDDAQIEIGGSFSKVFADGTHTITASVTDDDDNTDTASVTITVGSTPVLPGTVSVTSFEWSGEGGKDGKKHLLSTVNLDGSTTVNVELTNELGGNWTGSGSTGDDGSITFTLKNAPKSMYTIEVKAINGNPTSVISTTPYSNS